MKILITGGAGFIASNIAEQYLRLGHEVVIVDNLYHGFKKNLPQKAVFYQADIRDMPKMKEIIQKEKPEVINHHAAFINVVESVSNPKETVDINVAGTINLLVAASENKVRKFIFSSTGGAIYSGVDKYPIAEEVAPRPESPYGLSKLLGEEAIKYYARVNHFEYLIFRYANIYGPRQDTHGEAGVLAIFSELLREHKSPIIFGDGTKTRDYVYVKDVVTANVLGLTKGKNVTLNLGVGQEITDQQVYDELKKYFANLAQVKYEAVRPGEILRSSLDAKKAQTVLGWQAQYSFSEGVKDYLKNG
ncbi:MAG: hypothetical protein A2233_03755 [Candidatus Kerfeldbacteria bacterium RIFOXYA2_FULL_38_24]|uniref:NAD-dependent epimerase/dehydratase domain-containing protein n=1 Tax=Candidatus Kerfeldbacteria bacterium RIFOXYB2_FULL_38_14 TaxID=1798547 RepID=A0A1G2BD12_9BACT|nr:MAG: hypothetical protein A2233_03755 [Candidatus Kerfeldbacteria bacterium RIFOXYA2_FULL_38_24]OGY86097.1 MAG: hypothetical protein A2319_01400 [Candidatus Kerfeldbacteria bacterium RIFOXYB2_FULL_38_14]OGY89814.1 MAG: hypothetical protein A2458_05555 [Candidatus Kerfeldbacteria bacterium RIFOXYC2_FULL_38_9]